MKVDPFKASIIGGIIVTLVSVVIFYTKKPSYVINRDTKKIEWLKLVLSALSLGLVCSIVVYLVSALIIRKYYPSSLTSQSENELEPETEKIDKDLLKMEGENVKRNLVESPRKAPKTEQNNDLYDPLRDMK